jgi:hypothetical protein
MFTLMPVLMTMKTRPIVDTEASPIGDFRRYPGCRLVITCTGCDWQIDYSPERVIDRLRELRAGGHPTPISQVARRVTKRCPRCHEAAWRAGLAWPAHLDAREIKRLANLYRN